MPTYSPPNIRCVPEPLRSNWLEHLMSEDDYDNALIEVVKASLIDKNRALLFASAIATRDHTRGLRYLGLLLEHGAMVDSYREECGSQAIHTLAAWNCFQCVSLLLKAGADANARSNDGTTPMHRSMWLGNPDRKNTVMALLAHGADINARDKSGQTPLGCLRAVADFPFRQYMKGRGAHL